MMLAGVQRSVAGKEATSKRYGDRNSGVIHAARPGGRMGGADAE
jgi:hypothetical protein